MDTAWILVAHRSGAQLFENRDRKLSLLQEIPHGEGRLQDKELATDKPGRSVDRQGKGRHAVGSEQQQAAERETMQFVRELAYLLETGRVDKRYSKLVLVAAPRFLGELRSALTPQTESLIAATQNKDLAWMKAQEVEKYLQSFVWPSPAAPRQ